MATIRGGDKYEKAIADLVAKLGRPAVLRVGFLENATYPDGKPVALVAAWNEFGTSSAPPRPFFRNMVAAKAKGWPKGIAESLKRNDLDVEKSLLQAGEGIKGQLQTSIRDLVTPALAPSTIRRKGHDKPLIETAHMLNSVDYDVKI